MNILNKITMKAIGAQPAPHTVESAKVLAHVYGKANGYDTGSTNYGFYDKIHGEFEAVNLETGEIFAGANLLCPPIMENLIKQALKSAGAEGGKIGNKATHEKDVAGKDAEAPVLFAFAVGVKPTPKKEGARDSGSGYEYTVSVLTPSKRSDALESLRLVSENARNPALPAPGNDSASPSQTDPPAAQPGQLEPAQDHGKKHAAGAKRR